MYFIRKKIPFIKRFVNESRLIRRYFSRHKSYLFSGILCLAVVDILLVIQPLIIKFALDSMLARAGFYVVAFWSLSYLVLALIQALMRYGWRINLQTGAMLTELDIRKDYTEKLFSISVEQIQGQDVGGLLARANSDVVSVRRVFDAGMIVLFDSLLYVTLSPVAMFFLAPDLALIAIIPIPLIMFLVIQFDKILKRRYGAVQERFSGLIGLARGVLRGLRQIRTSAKESHFIGVFRGQGESYVKDSLHLALIESALGPLLDLVVLACVCLVFWVGGNQVLSGAISIGTFVAFQQYLLAMRWPAQALGLAASVYQRGLVSSARLESVLSLREESAGAAVEHGDLPAGELEVRKLSFSYPGSSEPVLRNVSFRLRAGERLAIVGQVGAGKTTLAHVLASLLGTEPEKIFLDGKDLYTMQLSTRRGAIKLVSQAPYLFNATVRTNLAVGSIEPCSFEDFDDVCSSAHVLHDIQRMSQGYDTLLGDKGIMLSGGQRQRLTIARALLGRASVVIFDDALSSVDVSTEKFILEALDKRDTSRSEIFITHRLSTALRGDRILVLEDGEITGSGTHQELLSWHSWYQGFVQTQLLYQDIYDLSNTHR